MLFVVVVSDIRLSVLAFGETFPEEVAQHASVARISWQTPAAELLTFELVQVPPEVVTHVASKHVQAGAESETPNGKGVFPFRFVCFVHEFRMSTHVQMASTRIRCLYPLAQRLAASFSEFGNLDTGGPRQCCCCHSVSFGHPFFFTPSRAYLLYIGNTTATTISCRCTRTRRFFPAPICRNMRNFSRATVKRFKATIHNS